MTWLIHTCDTTQFYLWQDSFVCVIWLIHMGCRNMNHSSARNDSFIWVPWLGHMRAMTQLCMCHDSLKWVAWLIHISPPNTPTRTHTYIHNLLVPTLTNIDLHTNLLQSGVEVAKARGVWRTPPGTHGHALAQTHTQTHTQTQTHTHTQTHTELLSPHIHTRNTFAPQGGEAAQVHAGWRILFKRAL